MAQHPDIPNDPDALSIYQANLDAVSYAVLNGPLEDVLDHLREPYFLRSSQGLIAYNNRSDILDGAKSAQLSLRVLGATDYVRTAQHAFFRSETEIEGLHSTRILRGNALMTPAYDSRMKLQRSPEGKWQVAHAEHAQLLSGWPMTQIASIDANKTASLDDISMMSQADEIALMTYQEYLDTLTVANVTHDFDLWKQLCCFPHKVIIDNVTRIMDIAEDIKPFFDMVSGQVRENPEATLKRQGEFATFVNSHTIRGYHRTTFEGGGTTVFPPVRGRFTIELQDGRWRMTETVNAIANTEFPYTTPIVSEALGSELDQKKDLTR